MTGYTQRNTREFKKDEKTVFYYTERFLNEKGLNGKGQIITVCDTYADFNHSMFYDPNSTFDVNVPLNHRKFVYYNFNGTVEELEQKISKDEHGTHVAGTIEGESICSSNRGDKFENFNLFDGNAPKSKLIYFKLNSFTIEKEIQTMNKFGSHISSNSWDYTSFDDEGNFAYGMTAYENPDKIFIFAGNLYQGGNFTVLDPSGSKNVLAVGSIEYFYNEKHLMRFQSVDDDSIFVDAEEIQIFDPIYSGIFISNVDDLNKLCDIFSLSKLFLIYSTSSEKVEWIKKCYVYPSKEVFVSFDIQKVQELIEHSKGLIVSAFDVTEINISKPIQHAYYSSGGHGNKGIIKPDVSAPGTRIFSTRSVRNSHQYHCCGEDGISHITVKEGTSQATPNVAGAAALISQYFEEGRWNSQF